ncbi:GntR family transcriptional regulator [Spirochaeta isovalerica]|uniref:GntR family transcriptional regulator of arabinose operon n=1 Tax=Spirochaeta isovalerica TaxID=150 RepID=A0A841R8Q5_9SPIO|nr:GntR family transcriptional regulator [Spirochaeta isovalerica]MBB6479741.1 GntR family transcriptional regulator of arabinose operon [Spirochaeta isovalerica]
MKKYERIAQWVRDEIAAGNLHPGDKLPSENELTQQFQVSRNAVRQAIDLLNSEGITETMKGIGTFCRSKSVNGEGSRNIGFVCFFTDSYIFPRIIKGCSQVLYKEGYQLMLNQSEYDLEREREILETLRDKKVEGIIIEPVFSGKGKSNMDLLLSINEQGIPIFLMDNQYPLPRFSSITMDDRKAGYEAAKYLWEMGHREIGIFYQKDYLTKMRRREGALEFLSEQGVSPEEILQVGLTGQGEKSTAWEMAERFFETPRMPTAVICTNDEEALKLIGRASEKGIRVPEDLSVISFDNSEMAQMEQISLTSFEHPGAYIGHLAAKLLLEQISNPELGIITNSVIEPRLIRRKSVRKLYK